jgi:hypothetical protein
MRGLFNKMFLIITDGLTKELCIGAYLLSRTIIRLGRRSGWLFVALYLKKAASSLQAAYGGVESPPTLLPVPVSLTRSGYPRIIPPFWRRIIRKKDERADVMVRICLSCFSLSKRMILAKPVSRDTFKSIVSPLEVYSCRYTI